MKSSTNIQHLFHLLWHQTIARTICCRRRRQGTNFGLSAWFLGLALMIGMPHGLRAQVALVVPATVNYQGRLESLATNKTYVDGVYTIEFRVWDTAASSGTLLWGESYSVYVKSGNFNVMLGGGGGPLNPTGKFKSLGEVFQVNGSTERYLGITVRQDEANKAIPTPLECVPRQQMLTAPFAFQSQYSQYAQFASSAGNGTFFVPNGLQVSGSPLSSGEIVICNQGLTVAGAKATLNNGLTVSGATVLNNGLDVSGQSTLRGTVALACSTTGGGVVPIGGIIMWSGSIAPAGWALCDGLSTLNGAAVPDLRGRFVLGQSSKYTVRDSGGSDTHTNSVAEMATHSHSVTVKALGYVASHNDNNTVTASPNNSDGDLKTTKGFTSATAGTAAPYKIMPPYYVLAYIIRMQ